jgi:hypothetical protein
MKCLKNQKTGDLIRVTDVQANQMAGSTWKYASKSEWKSTTRVPSTNQQVVESEKKEKTISKKQARKAKFKTENHDS